MANNRAILKSPQDSYLPPAKYDCRSVNHYTCQYKCQAVDCGFNCDKCVDGVIAVNYEVITYYYNSTIVYQVHIPDIDISTLLTICSPQVMY